MTALVSLAKAVGARVRGYIGPRNVLHTVPARARDYPKSIPRVPGAPIFGSLLELRRDRVALQLRVPSEQGELAVFGLGAFAGVMVTSPEIVHEIMVEKADAFVKSAGLGVFARPLLGSGLLTSEHDFHKRQRRMMAPMFVHKRIVGFSDEMVRRAVSTQARWKDGETIDAAAAMMRMTLEIVGKTLFDAEVGSEAAEINTALEEAMEFVMKAVTSLVPIPPAVPTKRNARNREVIARLDETVYRMIRERRAATAAGAPDRGDFLSLLLAARDEEATSNEREGKADGMTDVQVRDESMTLFLAGHETTANAMAWTLYLLAKNPDVRARLEAEIDDVLGDRQVTAEDLARLPYALQVVKESMRLYPPAYVTSRMAERDVTIAGHAFPRGSLMIINIMGMHRSARWFPAPDRFDPDRFAPAREKEIARHAYMPFGAGPRICIGSHFALLEAHLALITLTQHVRLELVSDEPVAYEPLITLRPRGGIPMRVLRRRATWASATPSVRPPPMPE
ncbi:MAG: cytochrome P450 [Polyangiales bacterium]